MLTRRLVDAGLWCVGLLPESLARLLGRALGLFTHRLLRYRLAVVRQQMRAAFPALDQDRLRCLERDFYRHLGLTLVETLRLAHLTDQEIIERTRLDGLDRVDAAFAQGKGVFILGAHAGSWETAMAAWGARGYRTHVVVKEIKSVAGQHLADRLRSSHGVISLPRRGSIKQIFRVLRENEGVGFVLDQNTIREEGVFVDFFGRPACTMPGLAIMVGRTGAPVLPLKCYREPAGLHRIEVMPPIPWEDPEGMSREEVVRHNTQRYTAVLEDIIREHPAQWLWVHKRWKTRPREEQPTS